MTQTPIVLLAIVVLLAAGCKKVESASLRFTKNNIIGAYKITSIKASANGAPAIEVLQPCQKDDITDMKATMIYTVEGGAESCEYWTDVAGNWDLPISPTLVIGDVSYTIQSCDSKQLVISGTIQRGSNSVVETTTYMRQ